jgi:hypothetical protein
MRAVLLALFSILSQLVFAQEYRGFLYGTVTLKNNKSYTGQMRWDENAGAWDDLFEAYKNEPQLQEKIEIQGYETNETNSGEVFELSFMKLWENKDNKSRFAFKCQFGHIDKITDLIDDKYATLLFKNGERLKVRRRGNDVGEDIIIYHKSLGKLELDWEDIKEIDFSAAPKEFKNYNGSKIYGKALAVDGPVEGFVVWDFDEEAFDKDIINGYHQKVEYDIEFANISSLKPEKEGAILTLKNNDELFVGNSSDVNQDNDGIFIKTEKRGMINLSWPNLIKIDFTKPTFPAKDYETYSAPEPLLGRIETKDGETFQGNLAYDLDELWDIEILDGQSKGARYYIPFYLIKSISPQNYNYSLVELNDGTSLMLGEEGDVSSKNNGVLVWLSESKTKYVPWKNIKSLTFKHK